MASQSAQRPPITSHLRTIIKNDDLTNFTNLVTSSNWHEFQEQYGAGDNLLHLAIRHNSWDIFSRLISYPNLDLVLEEENKKGETALAVAVNSYKLHENEPSLRFIETLLDKGANHNFFDSNGDSLISSVLKKGHRFSHTKKNIEELVSFLLCSGVSPWTQKDLLEGTNSSFELAALRWDSFLIETLFLYTFDEDSSFVMRLGTAQHLVEEEPPYLIQILNSISAFRSSYDYDYFGFDQKVFYKTDISYLRILIEKPGISEIFTSADEFYCDFDDTSLENLSVIFESRLKFHAVNLLKSSRSFRIFKNLLNTYKEREEMTQYFCFLTSNGLKVSDKSLQLLWQHLGDGPLFRMMLHMDFQLYKYRGTYEHTGNFIYKPLPELLYNVNVDIYDCIMNFEQYDRVSFRELLCHSALPFLKKMVPWKYYLDGVHLERFERLPDVPSLQELSRNCLKKFLVAKFNIKTPRTYYTVVNSLPAPEVVKRMITFERALY